MGDLKEEQVQDQGKLKYRLGYKAQELPTDKGKSDNDKGKHTFLPDVSPINKELIFYKYSQNKSIIEVHFK